MKQSKIVSLARQSLMSLVNSDTMRNDVYNEIMAGIDKGGIAETLCPGDVKQLVDETINDLCKHLQE